jgi:hypothetical protein
MKFTKCMAMAILLLLAVSGASAQSLGDYARAARKNKPQGTVATHHYDNDNLPTSDGLSVVGPPATSNAGSGEAKAAPLAPSASDAERQKKAEEWKEKIEQQKRKVDALNHELDLDQRELQLRAVQLNADPTIRLRDGGQWDKKEEQFKSDVEEKQKALNEAKQQLDDIQDQAHKAGALRADDENDDKDKDKDKVPNK